MTQNEQGWNLGNRDDFYEMIWNAFQTEISIHISSHTIDSLQQWLYQKSKNENIFYFCYKQIYNK